MCLHSEASSFLLFKDANCGLHIIINFSLRHRLHLFVSVLYGCAFSIILHVILCCMLLSFSDHMCELSVVAFLFLVFLKLAMWFLYLSLKVVDANPMYVSSLLVFVALTVA